MAEPARGRRRHWPILLLALTLSLVACGRDLTTGELEGVTVDPPSPKPSFVLHDTAGEPFDFAEETDGMLTLLYFGYLSCPDICPVHLAQIAEVFDRYPDVARETKVVFVSVDPGRDSPDEIRSYLDAIDTRFIGLTGTESELKTAQEAAGVPPATFVGDGDDYTVNHAAWVIAYAPDGLNHTIYPFGTRQTEWSNDLQVLVTMGRS